MDLALNRNTRGKPGVNVQKIVLDRKQIINR